MTLHLIWADTPDGDRVNTIRMANKHLHLALLLYREVARDKGEDGVNLFDVKGDSTVACYDLDGARMDMDG